MGVGASGEAAGSASGREVRVARFCPQILNQPPGDERKGPGMPEQVEDVERLVERPGGEHPYFLYEVRLGVERSETKQQGDRDEELVFGEFHGLFHLYLPSSRAEALFVVMHLRYAAAEQDRVAGGRSLPPIPFS